MNILSASRWLLVLPAALLCACGSHPHTASATNQTLHVVGKVLSETASPVAGATVTLPSIAATATTDATGAFDVTATGAKIGDNLAIVLNHPAYSPIASTLYMAAVTNTQDYNLRLHDVSQTITLPTDANTPVTVSTTRADGGTTLSIGYNELVTPSGAPATGAALVKLTYWHPTESLDTAPAPLDGTVAGNANVQGLITYGMVNIEISQGNDLLQVASGKTLSLNFTQPAVLQDSLTGIDATDANDTYAPMLWYADSNTGVWTSAGSLTSGALSLDPNGLSVTAQLPHLSAWNVDGITTPNLCVNGSILDCNNNAVANKDMTLWVLGGGQLTQYDITTGADGSYCANLIGSSDAKVTPHVASFSSWVSGRQAPADTTCNPTGVDSYSALCTVQASEHECAGSDEYATTTPKGTPAPVTYTAGLAKCKTPTVTAPLCGYCAGTNGKGTGNCLASEPGYKPKIGKMTAGACGTIPPVNYCPTGSPTVDICSTKNARKQGDSCTQTIDCCPSGTLTCSDFLCVPLTDAG